MPPPLPPRSRRNSKLRFLIAGISAITFLALGTLYLSGVDRVHESDGPDDICTVYKRWGRSPIHRTIITRGGGSRGGPLDVKGRSHGMWSIFPESPRSERYRDQWFWHGKALGFGNSGATEWYTLDGRTPDEIAKILSN